MKKTFDELTITDNFMFSKVMRNPKLCRHFLELILNKKIKSISIPEYESVIDLRYDAKSIRLDIRLDDDEDTTYNMEMQAAPLDGLIERTRYYHDLIDLDLIEKGHSYKKLNHCIVLFICTFDLFGKGRVLYRFENRCVDDPSLAMGDGTETMFVNTLGHEPGITQEFQEVLDYFNGKPQTGGFAAELQKEVEKVKLSREWRREYMTLQIYVDDIRREEREAGRQEGIQKGIQKGIQDGEIRKLISQVMKKLSSGKDIERIAEETEESRDSLEPIIDVITSHPDYDLDEVFDCLNSRQ